MADIDGRIAHHEAGHIVAARRLGLSFDYATLEPTNDSFAHVNVHEATSGLANDADLPVVLKALETDCKVWLAGPYAELRYEPDTARKQGLQEAQNWGKDMRKAKARVASAVLLRTAVCSSLSETQGATADAVECERLFAPLSNETETLIATNWSAIKRVAERLQHQRTITQIEADALIAGQEAT